MTWMIQGNSSDDLLALILGRVLIIAAMPRLFKRFPVLLALTSVGAAGAPPEMVTKGLRDAEVPQASVSILVQEVGARRPSLALNPETSRNPASVMKLVTTYAALELLGPAYRWKTEVYRDGEDLILKGTGDPKLNYESFWMLLRNLRARGLRDIRGDIVLDRSYFGPVPHELIDDEMFRPYNVAPDALLVNFKSMRFVFWPEEGKVRMFVEPQLPGLELVNGLKLSDGACPEGRAFRDLMQAAFESKPPRAAFTGFYPVSCGERELNVALHHPEDYVAGMIRALWFDMGGTWTGRVHEGAASANARLLYTHESEPLAEIARDINKFSNNVMARQLYLTLAAELGGAPAQPEAAARAICAMDGVQRNPVRWISDGKRLRPFTPRARKRRDPDGAAAGGVEEPGDARVHGHAAGGRGRRHDAQAPARRGGRRQRAHQDRAALRCARDGRLCARPQRAASRGGDDREPPERASSGGRVRRPASMDQIPRSCQSRSTRRFTASSMTIGRPQRRPVSPGHLLVASMPILEPSPETGLAKSR